jgi:hypothetical protein
VTNREQAKKRLVLILEELATWGKSANTLWPSRELLQSLEESVVHLIATQRKKPPSPAWKAFELLDRRMPSLRLVLRVDNLAKHALERFEQIGESPLDNLARQNREDAQNLLRDIERLRTTGLSSARVTDWAQHEKRLAKFSRTRTVELACNQTAPLGVRCYTRALELLLLHEFRHKSLRKNAAPLVEWLAQIKHPQATSLLEFDRALASAVAQEEAALREKTASRQREKERERTRRHREWHRGKWVYPGDWLWFRDAGDFAKFWGRKHPMPTHCSGLQDSEDRDRILKYDPIKVDLSCGCRLADGFYYHRTRHVARCRDCQEAEWWARGFEVEDGFPYGDWQASTDERIAERDRYYRSKAERELGWLKTPKGQQWLQEANRRFEELQRANKARKRH